MTKLQSTRISTAIDKIVEGLGLLRNAVEMLGEPQSLVDKYLPEFEATRPKPQSLVDKFPAEFEATRPKPKPIQLKLPIGEPAKHRGRLGDVGYEDEANPVRQAVGQLGGLATAGVKRAPCPDRRPRGTVMVKNMSVNEKRRYWRWIKHRADCRAFGRTPATWAEWVGERG